MVRARIGVGLGIVASMTLLPVNGVAAPLGTGIVLLAAAEAPAQVSPRMSRPQIALNSAIETCRRGDYEAAAQLFQQAQAGMSDLSADGQKELPNWINYNNSALRARREGAEQLRQAEDAVRASRSSEASDLLRKVLLNQFLTPADKDKAQRLAGQLRPGSSASTSFSGNPTVMARTKLQQARALMAQANFEGAEQLAREADALHATYATGEDTPRKVLDDVAKMRSDPKAMLAAARMALQRGDLDRAEQLARASDKASSTFAIRLWGDSPAKVLKEVQAARAQKEAQATRERTDAQPPPASKDSPNMIEAVKHLFKNKDETPPKTEDIKSGTTDKPAGPGVMNNSQPDLGRPTDPALRAQNTENARLLIRQGRAALQQNNIAQARQLCQQAASLKPELNWGEDGPEQLQADIQRVSAATNMDDLLAPGEKDDPRALLKRGRQLLFAGRLDEARPIAQRAKTVAASSRWSLFEDSPDKLQQDIDKALAKRDQEESVRVLAEGRKMLEQSDFDGAAKAAYQAQKLHGQYSIWDMGDRPQKLLADTTAARDKSRKTPVPPVPATGVAKNEDRGTGKPDRGMPGVDEARAQQARQMLGQARQALRAGEMQQALLLVDQVERMQVTLTRPGDDSPAAVRRDIEMARVAPDPNAMPAGARADAAKQQALQLLAEARQLQRDGLLVEAHQKASEANKLGAGFGLDEYDPARAMLDLGELCRKRIDNLTQEATDFASTAGKDVSHYQKAESDLLQARQLAAGFGFPTWTVENKLEWVRQLRVKNGVAPPSANGYTGVQVAKGQMPEGAPEPAEDAQLRGQALLKQAELELHRDETGNARRLASEAYSGPYGMQKEAEEMLRLIDQEEFNQRRLTANRNYGAAVRAYVNQEYNLAANMFRTINPRELEPNKAARLKEYMMTPQMQPSAVTRAPDPVDPVSQSGAVARARATDSNAGVARATDTPETAFATQVQAMQEIKFQQLRQQGLDAQREAMERFKAHETDRSLEVLQTYLESVSQSNIDPERAALLRRPVVARLEQLRTLKVQADFDQAQFVSRDTTTGNIARQRLNEENKQKLVAEKMKQYHASYKEGKYKEAEMYASMALELDPDNSAAAAGKSIAEIHRRQDQYDGIKKNKQNAFLDYMDDADDMGALVNTSNPLLHDVKRTQEINKLRGKEWKNGIEIFKKSDKERELEQHLNSPVTLSHTDTPLKQVIDDLRAFQNINIETDDSALQEAGISLSRPVTVKLDGVSLKSALNILLNKLHLTYVVQHEVLLITTAANASGKCITKTYQVADLVIPVQDYGAPNATDIYKAFDRVTGVTPSGKNLPAGGGTAPPTGSHFLPNGTEVDTYRPGGGAVAGTHTGGTSVTKSGSGQTIEGLLINLITNTIKPESWSSMGGPGTIDYFPLGMALVINQTPDIQEQIQQLLEALRRLQDQEVAVEVRFISIAEGFFERIGVDFNINVKTNNSTVGFEPQLTSGQFQPLGFINDFNPSRFIAGLTPAGTFTSDLDIPVRASSFAQAIPPFGAFPNIPGGNGGLELGLAFLSDIQVFLFLEAAQGNQRTNVMQAPKLTLFNGQTATITVQDQQFFVTDVQVVQQGGQLAFVPTVQVFPNGVSLTIQAVISADRRFVRLSLQPQLTNLASAVVPLFPIVTPIIPLFEGGFNGPPVLFTQFIQQPIFNTISVQTTVNVPDGGTVLLGGLKRLSEGRNEFGPPILSKIPYINRLFKNVGYGRETESLMMMVTPRIIINEEEELVQAGYVRNPPNP